MPDDGGHEDLSIDQPPRRAWGRRNSASSPDGTRADEFTADTTCIAGSVGPSTLPHSGQPELLSTREGPVLHLATTGIHWTVTHLFGS